MTSTITTVLTTTIITLEGADGEAEATGETILGPEEIEITIGFTTVTVTMMTITTTIMIIPWLVLVIQRLAIMIIPWLVLVIPGLGGRGTMIMTMTGMIIPDQPGETTMIRTNPEDIRGDGTQRRRAIT